MRLDRGATVAALALVLGCSIEPPPAGKAPAQATHAGSGPAPAGEAANAGDASGNAPVAAPGGERDEPVRRLVAIGDVHGDLGATRAALRLAGAIDAEDHWIGGDLLVVQTGDQLDRGDDEEAILELFRRLRTEAEAAGGAFVALNGNHEIMNAAGDMRYVTEGGYEDFADERNPALPADLLAEVPEHARGRVAAFLPGGPWAKELAKRPIVHVAQRSVFVHGGLLPEHAPEIDTLNEQSSEWLLGTRDTIPALLVAQDGPIWNRDYGGPTVDREACGRLDETLRRLDVDRLVVGHTVQQSGITSACDGKVWRIDVGMAAHYGGSPAALEILGDQVTPLDGRG